MPKRRCSARIESTGHRCKLRFDESSDEATGFCCIHTKIREPLPECACCLKVIHVGSVTHVRPHCGHAIHYACIRQWVATSQSADGIKTCPSCRTPICPEMVKLLDDRRGMTVIEQQLQHVRFGRLCWHIRGGVMDLMDIILTVNHLLTHELSTVMNWKPKDENDVFVLVTQQQLKWAIPQNVPLYNELYLIRLHGLELCRQYYRETIIAKEIQDVAKRTMCHGLMPASCSCFIV